jgi:hypothetical protein
MEIRAPFRFTGARRVVSTSLGALVLDSGTRRVTLSGIEAGSATGEMTPSVDRAGLAVWLGAC